MPHSRCSNCNDFVWSEMEGRHRCDPLFHVINREEWFTRNDEREINELSQAEFDEIDWYKQIRAHDASEAAKKYLEGRCYNGDGQIDQMNVYVRDGLNRITRHTVLSEIVLEVREASSKEIEMPEAIEMCV